MDALFHASNETVRSILTALCDDDRVRSKALKYLDMIEPEAKVKANDAPPSDPNSKKRKPASTLSICVRCGETFYDGTTDKCKYHDGELEPDYDGDFWADHDERCHGVIDTDRMREDFPDGFVWDCCEKLGSEPGCRRGYHESHPDKKYKGYESESEDIGTSEIGSDDEGEGEEEEDEDEDDEDNEDDED
ncbi:uncharacterized protein B0H64DRAFT_435768 [Chaetomium fimeti]|uniref:C2H2-type domain-containing protein n=1 Tax=Chaetomium fimeti TaxID=1854472 RepID=A0AAE0H7H8_9PEZI|nr:hypothetical protein B0H64DRAFT_435768 [Chaetomium fimeti]